MQPSRGRRRPTSRSAKHAKRARPPSSRSRRCSRPAARRNALRGLSDCRSSASWSSSKRGSQPWRRRRLPSAHPRPRPRGHLPRRPRFLAPPRWRPPRRLHLLRPLRPLRLRRPLRLLRRRSRLHPRCPSPPSFRRMRARPTQRPSPERRSVAGYSRSASRALWWRRRSSQPHGICASRPRGRFERHARPDRAAPSVGRRRGAHGFARACGSPRGAWGRRGAGEASRACRRPRACTATQTLQDFAAACRSPFPATRVELESVLKTAAPSGAQILRAVSVPRGGDRPNATS